MASDETRRAISLDPRPRGAVRSLLVLDPSLLQWLAGRGWPSSHWAATEKSKSCLEAQPMVSVRHSRLQSTWRGSQMSLRDDMRPGLQKGKWGAGGLRGTCSSHSKQASKHTFRKKTSRLTGTEGQERRFPLHQAHQAESLRPQDISLWVAIDTPPSTETDPPIVTLSVLNCPGFRTTANNIQHHVKRLGPEFRAVCSAHFCNPKIYGQPHEWMFGPKIRRELGF